MGEKTDETFQVDLPPERADEGGERSRRDHLADAEFAAFWRLLPDLLKTHKGQYVAIHGGRVVDSGPESTPLIMRVHSAVGYVPIHVGLVTDEPVRPVRVHLPAPRPEAFE